MSDERPALTCCEIYADGEFVGLGEIADDGSVALRAGTMPEGAEVMPVEPPSGPIALIADAGGNATRELGALYPGRVHRADAVAPAAILEGVELAVVACDDADLRSSVAWDALESFARGGGTVMASLDDYAQTRGLTCPQRTRNERPHLVVEAEHELFAGCRVGDRIPWHNLHLDRPIFSFLGFRFLEDFEPGDNRRVLARSDALGKPVAVEERIGDGRIIALDLLEPRQDAGGVDGSRNKWVLPGNILGESVRYSRWWPQRLDYDTEYPDLLRDLAARFEAVSVAEIGHASDDSPLYMLRIGEAHLPAFALVGVLHGCEVMNAHGLLALVEALCQDGGEDARVRWLLEHFQLLVLPIMNPWGYRVSIQSSATDCDLNRNFPTCWDEYEGDPGRWFSNYTREQFRGAAPFSEPETQAIRDVCDREPVIGLIDYHQHQWAAGHWFMLPQDTSAPHRDQVLFSYDLARRRLRNRFLRDSETQLDIAFSDAITRKPFLRRWADSQGITSITQETVGWFEDSFSNGEVVAEVALAFCQAVGLAHLTASEGQP